MNLSDFNLTVYRDKGFIDISVIEAFEKEVGYTFPTLYTEMLSQYNQLRVNEDSFDFINIYGDTYEGGIVFLGYGNMENGDIEGYNEHLSDPVYDGEPGLVAIGVNGNGDLICFDYRDDLKSDAPKVVYLYHDDHETLPDGRVRMTINHVADSFEGFLKMLYEDDE